MLGARSYGTGDGWGVQLRPVVDQMSADKMPGSKSTDERQLSSHDGSGDDPSELLCVLPRISGMSTFDSQHLKDSLLRGEHSAAAHCPDLNAGHCYTHVKVLAVVGSRATG